MEVEFLFQQFSSLKFGHPAGLGPGGWAFGPGENDARHLIYDVLFCLGRHLALFY